MKNNRKALSVLLSLWVYTYALFYFVPLLVPSTTMLMYVWLTIIDLIILFYSRNISIELLEFLLAYILIALVNIAAVSYKYYVAIDAFSGMAVFLPALLIISSPFFNLEDFLIVWKKFAFIATMISPLAIVLMQRKIIDYGIFTYLNLPNCIIYSYYIMILPKGDKKKRIFLIFDISNFLIILLFGGRMAAFAAAFSIFLAYMISFSMKSLRKIIIILIIVLVGLLIINNLSTLLLQLQVTLNKYNLSSRSLDLLIEQMRTGEINIYMTRRNIIYDKIINYITERGGLPGGFGVSLDASNGQFYHPHNLFLQLAVMFGIPGGIFFIFIVVYRLLQIKKKSLQFEYQFTMLVVIEYLIISFTGGSILNNFAAIIGIGMIFFYQWDKQKNIDNFEWINEFI